MPVSKEFFIVIEKTINQHLIDNNWVFSFYMRQDELSIIREGMKLDFPNHERREAQYLEELQDTTTTNLQFWNQINFANKRLKAQWYNKIFPNQLYWKIKGILNHPNYNYMLMLSSQVSNVQDRLDVLTTALDVKDKRIQELQIENTKLRQTIAELDPDQLLQQVQSYKTALAEKEQQITDLSRTIDELTRTNMSTSFNRPIQAATAPSMS